MTTTMDTPPNFRTDVIAHRGGALEAPENTMGAMHRALELGVDGVEFDLQRTADHQLIILHDDTLQRTAEPYSAAVTARTGLTKDAYQRILTTNVNELTFAEIQDVDIGSFFGPKWAGERVAKFEDVLELIKKYPAAKLYAEIKEGDIKSAELVADVVHKTQPSTAQLWFIAFNRDVLSVTKKLLPQYVTLHVFHEKFATTEAYLEELAESARLFDGIDPCALPTSINEKVVDMLKDVEAEQNSKKILACWVWQKMPQSDMEQNWTRLLGLSVNAITTDKPQEFCHFMKKRQKIDAVCDRLEQVGKKTPLQLQNEVPVD